MTRTTASSFLASEVGVAVADLPPEALTAAQAVGYHKLLLQMVGAMRVPISKRRQAVDWLGILELLDDVRREGGPGAVPADRSVKR